MMKLILPNTCGEFFFILMINLAF